MEKTITITDDMETPLVVALRMGKNATEELRKFATDRGEEDEALRYKKDIQAIDQILELIRRAKWKY